MFSLTRISRRVLLFHLFNVVLLLVNLRLWSYRPLFSEFKSKSVQDADISTSDENGSPVEKSTDSLENGDPYQEHLAKWSMSKGKKFAPVHHIFADVGSESVRIKKLLEKRDVSSSSFQATDEVYKKYQVPRIEQTKDVNCAALLSGDEQELQQAEKVMLTKPKVPIYEETYLEWTKDCEAFKQNRGYVRMPLSKEEEEFPLAFSITMFSDVEQAERLLRAIYQPQNFYCIHIDTKSSLLIHQTVHAIAKCFDNVWVATHLDKIKWGDISVILLDVNCMKDIVKYYRGKYKYFINLTGQEFPLRSNLELVRIAKIFNGSNDIAGSTTKMNADIDRVKYRWTHRWSKTYQQTIYYQTQELHPPYHINLTFFKGELHGLFSRGMTEFIVESDHGKKYLDWCRDTGHPSEHYYNTLNYNEHLKAPGGYFGPLDVAHNYSSHPIVRVKNWVNLESNLNCSGDVVRGICVYGVRDAVWLSKRKELFANKFRLTFQYLGYDCLEELHRNRTIMRDSLPFDSDFYRSLPTVVHSRKDGFGSFATSPLDVETEAKRS